MENKKTVETWDEFVAIALDDDLDKSNQFFKNLDEAYPDSYFTVLSTYWFNWNVLSHRKEKYQDHEIEQIEQSFNTCVCYVAEKQREQQDNFIKTVDKLITETNNLDKLETLRFKLEDMFKSLEHKPRDYYVLDPFTYQQTRRNVIFIDGLILIYNTDIEMLLSRAKAKIKTLKKRAQISKIKPIPTDSEIVTPEQNTQATEAPKLVWTADKNHLYELIYALYKVEALKNVEGRKATIPQLVEAINSICVIERKGQRSGIRDATALSSKIGDYLKGKKKEYQDNIYFLDTLQSAFIESLKDEILSEREKRTK